MTTLSAEPAHQRSQRVEPAPQMHASMNRYEPKSAGTVPPREA